jgi:tRNA 5-methylaminomethyl-2-thiouridine biosynthesis bifunctional protein
VKIFNSHTLTRLSEISINPHGELASKNLNPFYYSPKPEYVESRKCLIESHDFLNRWTQAQNLHSSCTTFTLFETSLGTGVNLLNTWNLWNNCNNPCFNELHYIAVEAQPLSLKDLKLTLTQWPELESLSETFIAQYPSQPANGLHRIRLSSNSVKKHKSITLSLYFGPIDQAFEELSELIQYRTHDDKNPPKNASFGGKKIHVDSWFCNQFSDTSTPHWNKDLTRALISLSTSNSILSIPEPLNRFFTEFTEDKINKKSMNIEFSQSSFKTIRLNELNAKVLNALLTQGITLHRDSWFLKATSHDSVMSNNEKNTNKTISTDSTNNETIKQHLNELAVDSTVNLGITKLGVTTSGITTIGINTTVINTLDIDAIIIGAGISGAQTANALAKKGLRIRVYERGEIAQGGSGNRQGVVYTKPATSADALSEFNFIAQNYADHFYSTNQLYNTTGSPCGVLHIAKNEKDIGRLKALSEHYTDKNSPYTWIDKSKTKETCGLALANDALLLKKSGWLNPSKACRELLSHPNIDVVTQCPIEKIFRGDNIWSILDKNNNIVDRARYCIIANAYDALKFEQTAHLPLNSIRGQVSHLDCKPACKGTSEHDLQKLTKVLCSYAYIAPYSLAEDIQCLGASFNLNTQSTELNSADNTENIQNLDKMLDAKSNLNPQHITDGRVGFRCTTRDYFPIVGPIAKVNDIKNCFSYLSKKAHRQQSELCTYHDDLYCIVGMGSRGLAYSPICAQILADMICGDFLPIRRTLYPYLHPSRFIIRNLIRNKQ